MRNTHFLNDELISAAEYALSKVAFTDAATLSGAGMDPAAMGGMPPGGAPMDPAAMGGAPMDPSMAGGAAPPPPAPAGADPSTIAQAVVQALQQSGMGGAGGGGAGMAGGIKPKIDVNVEIMQIKHMLAKVIDALGVPVSAQEMTATPDKLMQMANAQQAGGSQDPSAAAQSAIPAIQPMQGASPEMAQGGGSEKQSMINGGVAFPSSAEELEWQNFSKHAAAVAKLYQYMKNK